MLYTKAQIESEIYQFQERAKTEKDFCEQLYRHATIRLLAFKYAYYKLSEEIVKDQTYDVEESSWYIMGRALGHLKEEETSPCLDFDVRHPLAEEGIRLALHYINGDSYPID